MSFPVLCILPAEDVGTLIALMPTQKAEKQQKGALRTIPFVRFTRTAVQFRCEDVEGMASQDRRKRHS